MIRGLSRGEETIKEQVHEWDVITLKSRLKPSCCFQWANENQDANSLALSWACLTRYWHGIDSALTENNGLPTHAKLSCRKMSKMFMLKRAMDNEPSAWKEKWLPWRSGQFLTISHGDGGGQTSADMTSEELYHLFPKPGLDHNVVSKHNKKDKYPFPSYFLPLFIHSVTKLCLTLATPWTVAHQAPLFMGFSRQEYWSGLLFPPPMDLAVPGIKPRLPALAFRFFIVWATREALYSSRWSQMCLRLQCHL